jgi:hypothetical protein
VLEPGVTYTTPNITDNNSWVGGVYQQNLTCWKWGDPGYCGPQPIVRPDGNINFSYGSSYIYQQHNPVTFLPQATGLQVTGFNFSFTAKNGNGWDDGRTDQLTALVRFWDTTGGRGLNNVLYRNEYALNYKFNWTNFNYSQTFTQPLSASSIGTVQYGFIGRDNNGWAGPYGPEINNVQFNLRYSVDPCVANPLHAPTCSGYLAALAQLMPPPAPTVTEPVTVQPVVEQTVATQQAAQQPAATTAPAPAPAVVAATPTSSPTPVASERTSSGGGNLSLALNLISRNAERERAFQQQAVAGATAEAQAAGDRALAVGSTTSSTSSSASLSTEAGTNSQVTQSAQTSTQTQQSAGAAAAVQVITNTQQQATQQAAAQQLLAPVVVETKQTHQTQSFGTQTQSAQEVDLPQQLAGFITDSANPLREMLLPPPSSQQPQAESRPLNRAVENNSAAGGVGLESLMTVPQNYAAYTQLVLRDATGYPPREVYRGQTVVDNRQALRGLGSDRKHQDLVNLQYK